MPSRRAAVAVLSAALLTGAVAGGTAAWSRVDPWGVLELTGLRGAGVEAREPTPTPTVTVTVAPTAPSGSDPTTPTVFKTDQFGDWSVDVPDGWRRIDQSVRWHDYLDPTLNLRLRIRFGQYGEDAKAAAEAAFAKRGDELSGFRSPGVDRVTRVVFAGTSDERTVTYYEFRYTAQEKEGTRYGVEWYLDGTTMVGGFGWAGQLDLVEPAMVRAMESLVAEENSGGAR